MKRVVMVVADGTWEGEIQKPSCEEIQPVLHSGKRFMKHSGVIPTVTRVSSATISTGCLPAVHGLLGNRVALMQPDGRLGVFDVGLPDFLQQARSCRGYVLKVPSISEIISKKGVFLACSNVSPGAAYMLDPEHHGWVFHRAGSFAPGGESLVGESGMPVSKGIEGDRLTTGHFLSEMDRLDPVASILWLGEPDTSLHMYEPGSANADEGMKSACSNIMRVYERVTALRNNGDDVLFIIASDHGMDTADSVVDINWELNEQGFRQNNDDASIVAAANGGSVIIAVSITRKEVISDLIEYLRKKPWAGEVYANHPHADGTLKEIGLDDNPCPLVFVNAAVSGLSAALSGTKTRWCFTEDGGTRSIDNKGMHGYLDGRSISPFLVAEGHGFGAGQTTSVHTDLTNIAPTILRHLNIEIPERMKGIALQSIP